MHTHIYALHTHMHTHICMCVLVYTHMHRCTHNCIHAHTHVDVCTHAYAFTCTDAHTCTYVHTYRHSHFCVGLIHSTVPQSSEKIVIGDNETSAPERMILQSPRSFRNTNHRIRSAKPRALDRRTTRRYYYSKVIVKQDFSEPREA